MFPKMLLCRLKKHPMPLDRQVKKLRKAFPTWLIPKRLGQNSFFFFLSVIFFFVFFVDCLSLNVQDTKHTCPCATEHGIICFGVMEMGNVIGNFRFTYFYSENPFLFWRFFYLHSFITIFFLVYSVDWRL